MTFKEALEQKPPILSDYKIVTMFVGKSDVQQLIDQNFLVKPDKGKWDDDTEARALAALIALRKAMRKHGANHALTFHNSIAKAEAFQKSQISFNRAVKGYGQVDCFHVSGNDSTGERKVELDRFRDSEKALITNAKCLTEGVDIPTIDAVLFADTKRSTVDIVQAAGRALRPADGKKMGYIVIPVLVDEGDPEAADKAFQDILMTLRAMASNDDRIIDYFRSIDRGKRPSGREAVVEFNVPDSVRVRLNQFVEDIETRTWHRLAKLSWMPFEKAREFAHSLELKSQPQWFQYMRGELADLPPLPEDIPASPVKVYKGKGWESWGDWLGTGRIADQYRQHRDFEKARTFVHALGLISRKQWSEYVKGEMLDKPLLPEDIPANPAQGYKNKGWKGWGDWLGAGTFRKSRPMGHEYRDFRNARLFVHELKLKNTAEWREYIKGAMHGLQLPEDIPADPRWVYHEKGWKGMGDWLGTGTVANRNRKFWDFKTARSFAQKLQLQSQIEWFKYTRGELPDFSPKPPDIPAHPYKIYRDKGWISWPDWLGNSKV